MKIYHTPGESRDPRLGVIWTQADLDKAIEERNRPPLWERIKTNTKLAVRFFWDALFFSGTLVAFMILGMNVLSFFVRVFNG